MTESSYPIAIQTAFGDVEEAFHAALDVSLEPRGPDSLFELVARLELPPGASVVDVGCGRKGRQAFELARRFGFDVVGVDLVGRLEAADSELADLSHSPELAETTAGRVRADGRLASPTG